MKKILIVFVLFLNTVHVVFGGIPEHEKKALLDFYKSTNGADWTIPWDLSSPVSTWQGVRVENDTVVSITLFRNNLGGTLPNSFGQFKGAKLSFQFYRRQHSLKYLSVKQSDCS